MGDIADFLENPFTAQTESPPVSPSGLRRKIGVAVRGATLGLTGTKPETLGESLIETGASFLPVAGISAVTGPAVGAAARAAGLELTAPVARIVGAATTGGIVGGIQEPSLEGVVKGAGTFGAIESGIIGTGKILSKIRGKPESVPIPELTPKSISKFESPTLSPSEVRKSEIEAISKTQPDLPLQTELPLQDEQQSFRFESPYGPKTDAASKSTSISDMQKAHALLSDEESKTAEQITADRKQAADLLRGSSPGRVTLRDMAVDQTGNRLSISPKDLRLRQPGGQFLSQKDIPVHFEVQRDPDTGLLIWKPLTLEADRALMELHDRAFPSQLDLGLGPEQLNFLATAGQGIKKSLDIVSKQISLATENIIKMSEPEADLVVANSEMPVLDSVVAKKTVQGALVDMLIKNNDIDPKMVEDIVKSVDEKLGISGLTGPQMKEAIDQIYRAADQLGITGAQRTAFVERELLTRGLNKEGKIRSSPARVALRKKMILDELNKRCNPTSILPVVSTVETVTAPLVSKPSLSPSPPERSMKEIAAAANQLARDLKLKGVDATEFVANEIKKQIEFRKSGETQ